MCVFIEAKKKTFPQRLLLLWLSWLPQTECWFKQIELFGHDDSVSVCTKSTQHSSKNEQKKRQKNTHTLIHKIIRANSLWIFIRDFSIYICKRNPFFALVFMLFRVHCLKHIHCAYRDIACKILATHYGGKTAFRPMRKRFSSYLHEMVFGFYHYTICDAFVVRWPYLNELVATGINVHPQCIQVTTAMLNQHTKWTKMNENETGKIRV